MTIAGTNGRSPARIWVLTCAAALAACSSGAALDGGVDGVRHLGGASPGKTTLRLVIPSDKSFCDQTTGCGDDAHITVSDAAGAAVSMGIPWCSTLCSAACMPSPCPGIACISQGFAVKTMEFQWDGSAVTGGTCGKNMGCIQPGFVPAGHYVAHMCATPGTLTSPDGGGVPSCTATGAIECVDVPFDLPSTTVAEGQLP
jgi:hypothetical protein